MQISFGRPYFSYDYRLHARMPGHHEMDQRPLGHPAETR